MRTAALSWSRTLRDLVGHDLFMRNFVSDGPGAGSRYKALRFHHGSGCFIAHPLIASRAAASEINSGSLLAGPIN